MAFVADYEVLFDLLQDELRLAAQPGRDLFAKIIAGVCTRVPILSKAGKASRIDRLIEAEAWSDCALALIELELPGWQLRRLAYDSGEWFCSLSRQPNLPEQFDDAVHVSHEVLSLALLRAFVEARQAGRTTERKMSSVPQAWAHRAEAVCCDNFA